MRVAALVASVVVASPALAAPAPIYTLPTTEHELEVKPFYAKLAYAKVTAATPVLTAQINGAIAGDAGVLGFVARSHDASLEVGCDLGIMTSVFVSWTCSGITYGDDGGTAPVRSSSAYFIENNELRLARVQTLFVADFVTRAATLKGTNASDLSMRTSRDDCTIDPTLELWVTDAGVWFGDQDGRCMLEWSVATPLLLKGSVLRRILDENEELVDAPDFKAAWAKAPKRFVAQADGVLDRATDLVWAATDNGADIDYAAAAAFAAAYRGGGFADWRLPREYEIEEIADSAFAHRDKTDCTKGKNALLVTPMIKLTCGLVWTSTAAGKGVVGMGFISGTPRISKVTEKKNYRALVVRDRVPRTKP